MATTETSRRRKCIVAAPSVIVTLPLVGHSLLGDDRRRLYGAANDVGSNLLNAFGHSFDTIGAFLDRGNFRPIGRAVENIERAVVFDAAEATGLPPHAVLGASRVVLLVLLALGSFRLMTAVMRSAGADQNGLGAVVALHPLALAATFVAGDHYSPITSYNLVLIGSVILTFATGLWVARDRDMKQRRLAWHEPLMMLGLGALLASSYDLTYLAPPPLRPRSSRRVQLPLLRPGSCWEWHLSADGCISASAS